MEQLAPRHQVLKRHEANSWAPDPLWVFTMTLRRLRGGSSPDHFSCRCASAATGVCRPSTPMIRCIPGSETRALAGGRSLYVLELHHCRATSLRPARAPPALLCAMAAGSASSQHSAYSTVLTETCSPPPGPQKPRRATACAARTGSGGRRNSFRCQISFNRSLKILEQRRR
jgi:hypothetical protein